VKAKIVEIFQIGLRQLIVEKMNFNAMPISSALIMFTPVMEKTIAEMVQTRT
jgi:hypothetical protein